MNWRVQIVVRRLHAVLLGIRSLQLLELVRYGCEVTAVDIAAQPVARLRAELEAAGLSADVVQADLLEWQPDAPFDAIYEQTCLCALAPAQVEAARVALRLIDEECR